MSTPAAELAGYREQRIAGNLSADEYVRQVDRLGPLIESGVQTSSPAPSEQARSDLNELRQKRIDGKVTEPEFFAQMDKLGPVAHPDTTVMVTNTDGSKTNMSPAELADVDAAMAPPDSGGAYRFDYSRHPLDTPESEALDTNIREALVAAKIPAHVGSYVYNAANELLERFKDAPAQEITTHVATVTSTLRERWGSEFKGRIDAVLDFVATIGGPVGDMIEAKPWMLADQMLLLQLDSVVQHRARRTK